MYGGGAGSAGPAFKQLHQTVKMLCKAVEAMSLQMAKLSGEGGSIAAGASGGLPGGPALLSGAGSVDMVRASIREEVREVEEQNKRQKSIIVRGLKAANEEEVKERFKAVSDRLVGSEIVLSDVVCISRDKDMFRAKILSDDTRGKILSKAKDLPNYPDLRTVFIHRDLTFKQRRELWQRRQRFAREHEANKAVSHAVEVRDVTVAVDHVGSGAGVGAGVGRSGQIDSSFAGSAGGRGN